MKEQSSKSVVVPKNLVVDGTDHSGNFAGDGDSAPFVVFDVERQKNIAGPFDTRDAGDKARVAILDGAVPMLDVRALQAYLKRDESLSPNTSREIRLAAYDIVIALLPQGGGLIKSSLHGADDSPEAKAALDGLESMILAHAVGGIDVSLPSYLEGIETAVEAIWNRYDGLDQRQSEVTVRDAAKALLNAFGGDTPSWLRAEAVALENALAGETVANERQLSAGNVTEACARSSNGKVVGKRGDARSAGRPPEIRSSVGVVVPGALQVVGGGTPDSEALRVKVDRAAVLLRDRYGMDVEKRYNSNGRSGGAFLVTDPSERGIGSNGSVGIGVRSVDDGSFVFNVMVDEHHLSEPALATSGGAGMFAKYAYVRVDSVDEAMRWLETNAKIELSNAAA